MTHNELKKMMYDFDRQTEYTIHTLGNHKVVFTLLWWKHFNKKRYNAFVFLWDSGVSFEQCFSIAKSI